jgi:hypothetical protein
MNSNNLAVMKGNLTAVDNNNNKNNNNNESNIKKTIKIIDVKNFKNKPKKIQNRRLDSVDCIKGKNKSKSNGHLATTFNELNAGSTLSPLIKLNEKSNSIYYC